MARLAIAGVIATLTLIPAAAMAQVDMRVGAPPIPALPPLPPMRAPMPQPVPMPAMPQPAPMPAMPRLPLPPIAQPAPASDRMASVPGGGNVYQAPSYGYTLPRQWIAPSHYVADYRRFGLPTPAPGYGWSRYYDDMVLTDRWGRVYDWRNGRDMRDGGGDQRPRRRDRSGIVGAIVGGAVGALTGNLIAGAGYRLAGSLIGGGLGALAGQAIDRESGRGGHGGGGGEWGYYERGYRPSGPHWFMGEYNGGYSCACGQTVTTTTTYAEPIVTKKVTYVTEYIRVPVKRAKAVRTKDRYLGGR